MSQINELLRQEVLSMAAKDVSVRESLIADGTLAMLGYHPRMEAVHRSNSTRLRILIEQHAWPGKSLVGADGAEAAWLIAQQSIGDPPFMRECLLLLKHAASKGEVPPWQPAMLEDRIRVLEGKSQIYGSQFGPNGEPYPIEDPEGVNDRRHSVGLDSIEERKSRLQKKMNSEMVKVPPNWEEEYQKWLRTVGWQH